MANKPAWQDSRFAEEHNDPLSGFANITDVMLVFAVGLLLALVSKSESLQAHFNIDSNAGARIVVPGKELTSVPESLNNGADISDGGMKSLGQVYQDPETGKLILIQQSKNTTR